MANDVSTTVNTVNIPAHYKKVYQFILQYSKENRGRFPTIRKIMLETDTATSTSVIAYYLGKLEDYGLLARDDDGKFYVMGSAWLTPFEASVWQQTSSEKVANG